MSIGVSGNTCKQCVAGTFCADEVTSTCPPNSVSSPGSESIEDCVCNAGYYRDGNICVKCGFDHYCTGDQIQRACPSLTLRTLGEFTSSLQGCVCRMGHFGAPGAACTECQPGTYQNLADQPSCSPCPVNTFFAGTGADDVSDCVGCPQNTVADVSSDAATDCVSAPGYYTAGDGTVTACDPGTFQTERDQSSCTDCASTTPEDTVTVYSSTEAATSAATCIGCTPDSQVVGAVAGTRPESCECNAGFVGADGGPCSPTAAGTYKATIGDDAAQPCGIGTYSAAPGAEACTPCPAPSTSTLAPGASTLGECECVAGYHGSGGGDCATCTPGFYCAGDLAVMAPCGVGFYSGAQATECTQCPADSSSSAQSTTITACTCNAGYIDTDNGAGVTCNVCGASSPGTFETGGVCQACDTGYYQLSTADALLLPHTSCLQCPAHSTTLSTGTSALTTRDACLCEPGYVATAADQPFACVACEAGSVKAGTNNGLACSQCAANTWAAEASASCTACPASSLAPAGSSSIAACQCDVGHALSGSDSCTECQPGSFKNTVADTSCTPCAVGTSTAAHGATACQTCPADTYAAQSGKAACDACHGSSSRDVKASPVPADSDEAEDCQCDSGHFLLTETLPATCAQCPLGTFKDSSGNDACETCSAGSTTEAVGAISSVLCIDCGIDTYSATQTAAPGHPVPPQTCQACPDDSSAPSTSTSAAACLCDPGFTATSDSAGCEACALGTYKTLSGSAPCTACDTGTVGVPDVERRTLKSESCTPCAVDTYQDEQLCAPCPANTASPALSDALSECLCLAGHEGVAEAACSPCAPGSVKPSTGPGSCVPCAAGTYSDASGASVCSTCPSSSESLQGSDGLDDCTCIAGYGHDGTSCIQCTTGKYSVSGGAGCQECPVNHYYPSGTAPFDLDLCVMCPTNSSSPSAAYGKDACMCDHGFIRRSLANRRSLQEAENWHCEACPGGTYCPIETDSNGQRQLLSNTYDCPLNSWSLESATSISECYCLAGYFGTDGNCAVCTVDHFCPEGAEVATACSSLRSHASTLAVGGKTSVDDCICNAGYYFDEAALDCHLCPLDSYCFNNAELECPDDSTAVGGSDSADDCKCHTGLFMQTDSDTGARECVPCPPNLLCVGGDAVPTNCAPDAQVSGFSCLCPAGSRCVGESNVSCTEPSVCEACPVDTFCAINQQTECPEHASAPAQSDEFADCVCADGYYLDHQTCHICPQDSYCANNVKTSCQAYDVNLATSGPGEALLDSCHCRPGHFRLGPHDTCKACPRDFYCPGAGETQYPSLVQCLTNEYTYDTGSTSRAACICDTGHKLDATGAVTICLPCGEGERCQAGEVLEFMCHFQLRTANEDHSKCECLPGYQQNSALQCEPCSPGSVKPLVGDHKCHPCPADHTSANYTHCVPCHEHSIAPPGSTHCVCERPRVSEEAACVECGVDHYFQPGLSQYTEGSCRPCMANASTLGLSGEALWESGASCTCDPGFVRTTQGLCAPCPPNHFEEDDVCVPCGLGASSPAASSSQAACTCNATLCNVKMPWHDCLNSCDEEVEGCSLCPPGSSRSGLSTVGNEDDCVLCAKDLFQPLPGQATCDRCPVTRETLLLGATHADNCTCRAGFEPGADPSPLQNCSACAPGHFKADPGDVACLACPIGTFMPDTGATVCLRCDAPLGTFPAYAGHAPAANTTLAVGAIAATDCVCTPGHFRDDAGACEACVVGSFKTLPGMQACDFCGANVTAYDLHLIHRYGSGAEGATDVSHCVQCPGGGHSSGREYEDVGPLFPMDDVNKCLCFPGYDSFDTTDGCDACTNFTRRSTYSHDSCVFCEPLHFFYAANEPCVLCQLTDLEPSEPIHSVLVNSIYPSLSWGTSEADCTCRPGAERVAVSCSACPAGTFRADITQERCEVCPVNQYQDGTRSTECKACPANSFTHGNGSTALTDCLCDAGFAWDGEQCVACPAGQFKALPDDDPDNRLAPRFQCKDCPDGTFFDETGAVACKPCGVNEKSDLPRDAQATCMCRPGFGGLPCILCAHGSYNPGNVLADTHLECTACPTHKNTSSLGNTGPEACSCVPGTGTADTAALAECAPCPDGRYAPGGSNIPCFSCGFGTISEPDSGASNFDHCQCNHELGLREVSGDEV